MSNVATTLTPHLFSRVGRSYICLVESADHRGDMGCEASGMSNVAGVKRNHHHHHHHHHLPHHDHACHDHPSYVALKLQVGVASAGPPRVSVELPLRGLSHGAQEDCCATSGRRAEGAGATQERAGSASCRGNPTCRRRCSGLSLARLPAGRAPSKGTPSCRRRRCTERPPTSISRRASPLAPLGGPW